MELNFDKQPYEPIKQLASINETCQQISGIVKRNRPNQLISLSNRCTKHGKQCNNVMYDPDMKVAPFDMNT